MEQLEKELTAIDYLTIRPQLNELGFTDDEIIRAIDQSGLNVNLLTDRKTFAESSHAEHFKVKEYIGTSVHHYTLVNNEGYEKRMHCNGVAFRVPAHYQGLKHGRIIHKLLENKFEWFSSFTVDKTYKESETGEWFDAIGRLNVNDLPDKYRKMTVAQVVELSLEKDIVKKKSAWDLYEMHDVESYDIYLRTERGSLYVPIKCLLNGDVNGIIERSVSYLWDYRNMRHYSKPEYINSEKGQESLKWYLREVECVFTDTANRLFNILENKL